MSQTDKFWKLFWLVVGICTLIYFIGIAALAYLYNPTKTADDAAVGLIFDPSRDPFATERPNDKRPKFTGEYFYKDSLPISFANWSWGINVNWSATDVVYEGVSSFRVNFLQDWSGMRVDASGIELSQYEGISLAIYPEERLGEMYIELFDAVGKPLGIQSLNWYVAGHTFTPHAWNLVSIPFENLFPEGRPKQPISGYAISTTHPGTAYFDDVHLEKTVEAYPRWYTPKTIIEPEKPDDPIGLPYLLDFSPTSAKGWKTVFGRFEAAKDMVRIGPLPEKTTGSMSFIRGSQNWADYTVDSKMYWGQTSAFSILVRYIDDGNFVSCAFSHYNETVQLYEVKHGVSNLLGTSPGLPIRDLEPWRDARAGASAQGNRVSCYVDGERILSFEVPGIAATGGVGIETWTRNSFDSPHSLQEFSVKAL